MRFSQSPSTFWRPAHSAACSDPLGAVQLLLPQKEVLPRYGKRLLLDSAVETQDWSLVADLTVVPASIDELLSFVQASIRLGRFSNAVSALNEHSAQLQLGEPLEAELRANIAAEEAVRQ